MFVVAQVVGLQGVLVAELGVQVPNVSSPIEVASSVQEKNPDNCTLALTSAGDNTFVP